MRRLLLCSIWIICTCILSGQDIDDICSQFKYLEQDDERVEETPYITYQIIDSTETINIFLINRTTRDIKLEGFGRKLKFYVEALDEQGHWKKLDRLTFDCLTGYNFFKLPSNSYTWYKVGKYNVEDGDFATNIRFVCQADGKFIYSEPIPAKINPKRFLYANQRKDFRYHINLLKELDISKRKSLLVSKARHHFKNKEYLKSFELLDEVLIKYHNYDYALRTYGDFFVASISHFNIDSKIEINILISKAVAEWQKIMKESQFYIDAQKRITLYREHLIERNEWLLLVKHNENCRFEDSKSLCKSFTFPIENVEILFND